MGKDPKDDMLVGIMLLLFGIAAGSILFTLFNTVIELVKWFTN